MKNSYTTLSSGLYLNYIAHGMGVIILAQNMDILSQRWGSIADVTWVISMLGIGRLLVLLVSGKLSDLYGRKLFVILGGLAYLVFLFGILYSPNTYWGCAMGIMAGIANSFLDAGTYPALMEAFPKSVSAATVMIKACVSAGQFILPLFIGMLGVYGMWYGWSFILMAVLLIIAMPLTGLSKYPPRNVVQPVKEDESSSVVSTFNTKWYIDGVLFVLYGYISQATFYLISQWLTKYGLSVAHMSDIASRSLMSYYSIGSLCCVFVTAIITKKGVKATWLLVLYTLLAMLSIGAAYLYPDGSILGILSFVIGFSAAGGVMQLGLVTMAEMYPKGKGTMTGIFYTAGSIASFTIPAVTGLMVSSGIQSVMGLDTVIAIAGFVIAICIFWRHKTTKVA